MPAPLFPFPLAQARPLRLAGRGLDVTDLAAFTDFLASERGPAPALTGGWGEDRDLYRGSALFRSEEEPRTIHLGIDVWVEAGTPVAAPLAATVHSFADNANFGDYGGTILLEHAVGGKRFWTLYGHLARRSLENLNEGAAVAAGEVFAWLGEPSENGGWPPHLHFQKILDLQGLRGDFPGVARPTEKGHWLRLCPDPSDLMV